jgi:hypothetical protein
MFSTRKSIWGPLNDVSYVIALLLIIPFFIGSINDLKSINFTATLLATVLAVTGILIITITQLRLVLKDIGFELNLRQGAFGSGLLGLGFILLHLLLLNLTLFPTSLVWLGLISGILMTMGIPTGLFYGKEEMKMTTGKLDWKKTSKLAITVVLSTFIGQIGLIAWVYGMGVKLINT